MFGVVRQSGGNVWVYSETGTIHALLTDVVMPRLNGIKLAERLSSLRPEMKVLYIQQEPASKEPSPQ